MSLTCHSTLNMCSLWATWFTHGSGSILRAVGRVLGIPTCRAVYRCPRLEEEGAKHVSFQLTKQGVPGTTNPAHLRHKVILRIKFKFDSNRCPRLKTQDLVPKTRTVKKKALTTCHFNEQNKWCQAQQIPPIVVGRAVPHRSLVLRTSRGAFYGDVFREPPPATTVDTSTSDVLSARPTHCAPRVTLASKHGTSSHAPRSVCTQPGSPRDPEPCSPPVPLGGTGTCLRQLPTPPPDRGLQQFPPHRGAYL